MKLEFEPKGGHPMLSGVKPDFMKLLLAAALRLTQC